MKDKAVLIVGGSGFLGKNILSLNNIKGIKLYSADLLPTPGFEDSFIKMDILDQDCLNNLKLHFDLIINLTGQVTNPSNLCFDLNSRGIKNIINYIRKNNSKLIQVSTLSVYGSSDSIINEESQINPETTYGCCKAMSEFLIQTFLSFNQYNIIRLSNLYGDKQSKGMLAYLLESLNHNKQVYFNNDGSLKRHLLNVKDAANLILNIASNFKPGIFNCPGNDTYTIRELILLFEEISERKLVVTYTDAKPWENLEYIDSTKLHQNYGDFSKNSLKRWLTKQIQNK